MLTPSPPVSADEGGGRSGQVPLLGRRGHPHRGRHHGNGEWVGLPKTSSQRVLTSEKNIFTLFFGRFFNFILTLCSQGSPEHCAKADSPTDDSVYDDSGVSDITSSSERSSGHGSRRGLDHMTSHMTADDSAQSSEDASSSEKWALVSHAPSQLTPPHKSHPHRPASTVQMPRTTSR